MSKLFKILLSPFTFVTIYGFFILYIYYQEHSLKVSVEKFKNSYFKTYEIATDNSILLDDIANHLTSAVNSKELDSLLHTFDSFKRVKNNFEQMKLIDSSNESYSIALQDFKNYYKLAENVAKSMISGDEESILIVYPKAEIVVELYNLVKKEFNDIKISSKDNLFNQLNIIDLRVKDILFYGAVLLLFHTSLIILLFITNRKKWDI